MIVFKLEHERPAYAMHGGVLYYIKDRCCAPNLAPVWPTQAHVACRLRTLLA